MTNGNIIINHQSLGTLWDQTDTTNIWFCELQPPRCSPQYCSATNMHSVTSKQYVNIARGTVHFSTERRETNRLCFVFNCKATTKAKVAVNELLTIAASMSQRSTTTAFHRHRDLLKRKFSKHCWKTRLQTALHECCSRTSVQTLRTYKL